MTLDFSGAEWLKIGLGAIELGKLVIIPVVIIGWKRFTAKLRSVLQNIVCLENDKQLVKFNDRYIKRTLFLEQSAKTDAALAALSEQLSHRLQLTQERNRTVDGLFENVHGQIDQTAQAQESREVAIAQTVESIDRKVTAIDKKA